MIRGSDIRIIHYWPGNGDLSPVPQYLKNRADRMKSTCLTVAIIKEPGPTGVPVIRTGTAFCRRDDGIVDLAFGQELATARLLGNNRRVRRLIESL